MARYIKLNIKTSRAKIKEDYNKKLVYPACFYKEEDGGYSVDIPDLLGCCTQGDNLEDAIMQA